jgi:flagellar biosynthesis/type III secretory pathway chaperone
MLINSLIENLEAQVTLHTGLLHTLNEELELTTDCTTDELVNIQKKRDRLAKEIFELEQTRIRIMTRYCTQNGSSTTSSISEILEDCEVKIQSVLRELKEQLRTLMEQIQQTGRKIAERSLLRSNCITEVQNVIQRALKRQVLYSKYGKITKPKGALVLQKAI